MYALEVGCAGSLGLRVFEPGDEFGRFPWTDAPDVEVEVTHSLSQAVHVGSEVGDGEIGVDCVALRGVTCQDEGADHLPQLPRPRDLAAVGQCSVELLFDRAAPASWLAQQLANERAHDSNGIDAWVEAAAMVLGCNERGDQHRWD